VFVALASPAHAADAPAAAPWAHNDLERLLVAGATYPAQRPAFLRALLTSEICALTDRQVPADLATANPNTSFPILGVQAPDGQPATPVFTAPERATDVFAGRFPVCLKGSVLLAKMRGQRVVLDPGQPYGTIWSPDDLDHLLGVVRTVSLADTQLTAPDKPPAELIAKLTATLGAMPEIKGAWLALAHYGKEDEWAWFLELHTDAPHQPIVDMIDAATLGVDMDGKAMDTSFLPPDAPPGTGIQLIGH
jgi:hypothetical protein